MKCFWPLNMISSPMPGCSLWRIWLLTSTNCTRPQQVVGVVGLEDEIVGAALEPADDVLRIGQRGHQDHGHVARAADRP